ncbi:MAG TPA: hypothetical protein VGF95_10045 [Solirubrobacteraceae bacterium]
MALAGCGSSGSASNDIESKSASQIVSTALKAAEGAHSVHVTGTVQDIGVPLKLDLEIVRSRGAKGTISEGGLTIKLVRIGGRAYINGGAQLYKRYGGAQAAKVLKGKWLEASATSGELAQLGDLTDLQKLLSAALESHGSLKKGATKTVNGEKAIAIDDTTHGGTLYVATTGKPYPIEIVKTGSEGGKFTFDSWGKSVSLSAPEDAINVKRLQEEVGS